MEVRDWPDLLGDAPVMGGAGCGAGLARLKRGQGSRHLGVDMAFNVDQEDGGHQRNKHFTSSGTGKPAEPLPSPLETPEKFCCRTKVMLFPSDEDLIKHILTDGHRFFPQADESEMADL